MDHKKIKIKTYDLIMGQVLTVDQNPAESKLKLVYRLKKLVGQVCGSGLRSIADQLLFQMIISCRRTGKHDECLYVMIKN